MFEAIFLYFLMKAVLIHNFFLMTLAIIVVSYVILTIATIFRLFPAALLGAITPRYIRYGFIIAFFTVLTPNPAEMIKYTTALAIFHSNAPQQMSPEQNKYHDDNGKRWIDEVY